MDIAKTDDIIVDKSDGIVAKTISIVKKYWIAILIVLILIVTVTFFGSGMFKNGFKPYQPRTDPQSDFDLKSELTRLTKRQEETLRRLKFDGTI